MRLRRAACLEVLELHELLLVIAGARPLARLTVSAERAASVTRAIQGVGLAWVALEREVRSLRDRGKGGWSSLYRLARPGETGATEVMLYVARDAAACREGAAAEESDDDALGELLGYPACCRLAYSRNFERSLRTQGDFALCTVDETAAEAPWSPLANFTARYFGDGLFSFYPCGLDCAATLRLARDTLRLLDATWPSRATHLRRVLPAPVLYTEYRGIFALHGAHLVGEEWRYTPQRVRGTSTGRLGGMIATGDAIVPEAPDRVAVLAGGRALGTVRGPTTRWLTFRTEFET